MNKSSMKSPDIPALTCPQCKLKFASLNSKKQHMKKQHKLTEDNKRKTHIFCPLCQKALITKENLRKHIKDIHTITVEKSQLKFYNVEHFNDWKSREQIETFYAKTSSSNLNNIKETRYDCNRSDLKGHWSQGASGSNKINGICPSNLIVKVFDNGENITVDYWSTHVGHEKLGSIIKRNHTLCPLCQNAFKNMENLRKHIKEKHTINVEKSHLEFLSVEHFNDWKSSEQIETCYAKNRSFNLNNTKKISYQCNRSDIKGYQSAYCKRGEKAGGSIKIQGICPSNLIVKIIDNDKVTVDYWTTHVGHDDTDLRSKHLSDSEKKMIVEKLQFGVPSETILRDARKVENQTLKRINLLNSQDIRYLSKKHNIEKTRDNNEMAATALKVDDCNSNGETLKDLKSQDFALGFMNSTMKEKPLQNQKIISMDGTHGTNRRGILAQHRHINSQHQEEKTHFNEQKVPDQERDKRIIRKAEITNWLNIITRNIDYVINLDDEKYERFKNNLQSALSEIDQSINITGTTKKKMETQENSPRKKKK